MANTALESYANDFETALASAVTTTTATTITVAAITGAPTSGNFRIRVDNELMLVTGGHGTTTWTVTRGVEGTTAATHSVGAIVVHVLTASALQNLALQAESWTHAATLHYEGSSITASANSTAEASTYVTNGQFIAQPFVLTTGTSVDRVTLQARKFGNGADVTISVRADSGGSPSTTTLASVTLPPEFLTTTARSVSLPLRASSLTNGSTYWVVISSGGTASNYLIFSASTATTPYLKTSTNGTTWNATTTRLMFDVFAGATGLLVNSTTDSTEWTELVYSSGSLASVNEYIGSFRNTRTLNYDASGVLIGVA